jgi:hypothetical protein
VLNRKSDSRTSRVIAPYMLLPYGGLLRQTRIIHTLAGTQLHRYFMMSLFLEYSEGDLNLFLTSGEVSESGWPGWICMYNDGIRSRRVPKVMSDLPIWLLGYASVSAGDNGCPLSCSFPAAKQQQDQTAVPFHWPEAPSRETFTHQYPNEKRKRGTGDI